MKASLLGTLELITVTIFGATMVLLYTTSCLYHASASNKISKKILRLLDHCNVFLLVFGTIIPIALIGIGGFEGWICFSVAAFVTVFGITMSVINIDKVQLLEVICHLINGWGILVYVKILVENIGSAGLLLVILGGIMYTIGALLYRIGIKKKYMHSLFHFFCLLGTLFHFLAIYLYIL